MTLTFTDLDPINWKKCSSCKKPIPYKTLYWVCNVSTCTRKRVGFQFCSVACWDAHLPLMNHRESWAEERRAPSLEAWKQILITEAEPKTRVRNSAPETKAHTEPPKQSGPPKTILRKK